MLIDATLVPYETDEIVGLNVMLQLCNWEWGARVLFSHERAVKYLTTHSPCSNDVAYKKYDVVSKAIQLCAAWIQPETMLLFTAYKQDGVHGEKSTKSAAPLVGT
jgi:hypothetical protein